MITTIADFLEELKTRGLAIIKENEDVGHPGLIGDMYEGLTQSMLNRAIFKDFNLKIVSGKITNGKGEMSKQIDCMVVEGEGRQLPFTNEWVYLYHQVIAVVEVKKNLFSDDIESSYENLRSVLTVSKEPEKDGDNYIMRAFRDSWRQLLRTELPDRSELESIPWDQQGLYHSLLMEVYYPVRIVVGYYGYKTEFSLRKGFGTFLADNIKAGNKKGFGPVSIPSLIICGNNSIIKNNGMPFGMPFDYNEHFYWHLCVSSNQTPMIHLLEIIWTRLTYKFNISSSIFGYDADFAQTIQFLDCRVEQSTNNAIGWNYQCNLYSEAEFQKLYNQPREPLPKWEPVFLTLHQFEVIRKLAQSGFIQTATDSEIPLLANDAGLPENVFVEQLIDTGLIYIKNNEIRFLTDQCVFAILNDGRFVAGEDKNGNFTRWLKNYLDKNR